MSGFDKMIAIERLEKLGWVEVEDCYLSPPESLWKNKPEKFYIHDAEDLENILNPNYEE